MYFFINLLTTNLFPNKFYFKIPYKIETNEQYANSSAKLLNKFLAVVAPYCEANIFSFCTVLVELLHYSIQKLLFRMLQITRLHAQNHRIENLIFRFLSAEPTSIKTRNTNFITNITNQCNRS